VIYTIAPSPVSAGQIWVGTDTGMVHLTRDNGKTWNNVTPQGLADWSKISIIDASHFDTGTAYAAVDRHRLDDIAPHIYRTHDFGKTWTQITQGIPEGAYVRAVREDTVRKGLLFAGTELGVYVSLNDGDSWQPLRLNMPVAPVHDLVVKNNDLVVATHGRSFWILDDISPLRQMDNTSIPDPVHLFKPATAIRIRTNVNNDTPLPPEEPAGENPPTGAIIYYSLKSAAAGDVALDILDSSGKTVRHYSSADHPTMPQPNTVPFAMYWFRPPEKLSTASGLHRFVWDLRYPLPPVPQPSYSISAAFGQSAPVEPEGPQVLPGKYQVRLTAGGKNFTAPVEVSMDPRVKASAQDLQSQFALEMKIYNGMQQAAQALHEAQELLKTSSATGDAKASQRAALAGISLPGTPPPTPQQRSNTPTLTSMLGVLERMALTIDSADAAPTTQATKAADQALTQLQTLLAQWEALKSQ
jgi:hypothetical protein